MVVLPRKPPSLVWLGALGVVYGDIGTSPLYAFQTAAALTGAVHAVAVASLILWTVILVVSLKYAFILMKEDYKGQGGVFALFALLKADRGSKPVGFGLIAVVAFGAALLLSDGTLTPAISVLSAVEGTEVVSKAFAPYVLPITIVILIVLFIFEKKGTAIVGRLFGPVMLLWFVTIGLMGFYQIKETPEILMALSPIYAIGFMLKDSVIAFAVMGSIFLVLTGAEALYADMGHFGIKPIKFAWFFLVMPCLLLNYFGQGAMFLHHPETIANPFFLMVPKTYTLTLVILATLATVIASQACISGAYSMTSEAILLGFLPRMKILFTSEREKGQIYVPFINWILCFIVIGVVLAFKKSDDLAAAYGIAVSTTMLMTTFLAAIVMKAVWKWNMLLVTLIITVFMLVDIGFFASNLSKVMEGGWLPMLIGSICFLFMMTWYQGRKMVRDKAVENGIRIDSFIPSLLQYPPHRVEGTAVFLTAHINFVPSALLHNLKHNRVLHERVIFLKISVWDVPRVTDEDKISVKDMGSNVYLVRAIYGFKETPDITGVLDLLDSQHHISCPINETSFFLARDLLVPTPGNKMSLWREYLFVWMLQNASRTADFFKIDAGRVIELGAKINL